MAFEIQELHKLEIYRSWHEGAYRIERANYSKGFRHARLHRGYYTYYHWNERGDTSGADYAEFIENLKRLAEASLLDD